MKEIDGEYIDILSNERTNKQTNNDLVDLQSLLLITDSNQIFRSLEKKTIESVTVVCFLFDSLSE